MNEYTESKKHRKKMNSIDKLAYKISESYGTDPVVEARKGSACVEFGLAWDIRVHYGREVGDQALQEIVDASKVSEAAYYKTLAKWEAKYTSDLARIEAEKKTLSKVSDKVPIIPLFANQPEKSKVHYG